MSASEETVCKEERSKVVEGGKLEVFKNGLVYRIGKDGAKTPAKITYATRNKKYGVVTTCENGKQKSHYVHRLVAEAFIPNPENKPCVNHKDGNPKNNHIDNLEWVTFKENTVHAINTGLIDYAKRVKACSICGSPTCAKDEVCCECKKKARTDEINLKKWGEIWQTIDKVDKRKLTKRQLIYFELRNAGKTLQEIADIIGTSKQCVDKSLKLGLKKYK